MKKRSVSFNPLLMKVYGMQKRIPLLIMCLIIFVCTEAAFFMANAGEVEKVNKEQLPDMLEGRDVIIIDVRIAEHWEKSRVKIKNAVREIPDDSIDWADSYDKMKTIVLYRA